MKPTTDCSKLNAKLDAIIVKLDKIDGKIPEPKKVDPKDQLNQTLLRLNESINKLNHDNAALSTNLGTAFNNLNLRLEAIERKLPKTDASPMPEPLSVPKIKEEEKKKSS